MRAAIALPLPSRIERNKAVDDGDSAKEPDDVIVHHCDSIQKQAKPPRTTAAMAATKISIYAAFPLSLARPADHCSSVAILMKAVMCIAASDNPMA